MAYGRCATNLIFQSEVEGGSAYRVVSLFHSDRSFRLGSQADVHGVC